MNQPTDPELEIAHRAECELWQGIRRDSRRQLTVATTTGVLYLLAALSVGVFLILAVTEVAGEVLEEWRPGRSSGDQLDLQALRASAFVYGVIGLVVILVYFATLLLIHDRLPSGAYPLIASLPWVGSTMRAIVVGEFSQSIYQSLRRDQTYGDAFTDASKTLKNAAFRRWSHHSAERIKAGQPMERVLLSAPNRDHPLTASAVLITNESTTDDSILLWQQATTDCHRLAQSRLARTISAISIVCLLASAMIATFALFLTVRLSVGLLDGMWF